MRRTVFFDFDNTLYSHKSKTVPPSAKKVLGALHEAGCFLVLATGRGLESKEMIMRETGFSFDAYIYLNGQLVMEGDEIVAEQYISVDNTSRIFDIADADGIAYGGFTCRGQALCRWTDKSRAVWNDFNPPLPALIEDFRDIEKIYLLQLYISEAEESLFSSILPDYVTNRPHEFLLSLIPKSAGKALGMKVLMNRHGLDKSASYAFGDGYNDVDMLRAVNTSIAMEDGSEELKRIASFIAPAADDDGILRAAISLGLIQ